MPSEVDPDFRSQNAENTISVHQMRLSMLLLMRQSYINDRPKPVIREAMLPLAKRYTTPWFM